MFVWPRLRRMSRTTAHWVMLALVLVVAGCDDAPLEPSSDAPSVRVSVPLDELDLSIEAGAAAPIVWIRATTPSAVELKSNEYVSMNVIVGRDARPVRVGPLICLDGRVARLCRTVEVSLRPDRPVSDLVPALSALDAGVVSTTRRSSVIETWTVARVRRFSSGVEGVASMLRGHPAVRAVERPEVQLGTVPEDVSPTRVIATALPTLNLDPAPPSAWFALEPGDTVTVEYVQPDGRVLSASAVF